MKYLIEYVYIEDVIKHGDCSVHVRHHEAESEVDARERAIQVLGDDVCICSVTTEEQYRRFTEESLSNPMNSLDALAAERGIDEGEDDQ
jgi:hypothetical protein